MSPQGADFTKPLLLRYVRQDFLLTDGQVGRLEREMCRFAQTEGFSMGSTYVEKSGTWPAAFEALIESVKRYVVPAVVLQSLLHFAVLGAPHGITDILRERPAPESWCLILPDLTELASDP